MTFFVLILALAVLVVGLVWLFQRRLIYMPLVQSVPPAAQVLPGAQEVRFPTADGLELSGWLVTPPQARLPVTFLVFNGNAGNRSFRAPLAETLTGLGASVFLFDYRGYGGNDGSPSETGLMQDARAAWSYLSTRQDVDPDHLVFFGESLGAAVALGLAVEHVPAGLILRSPFTSMVETARYHYPFLPVGLLLADRYPSRDRIGALRCPLLVLAGDDDRIVPLAQSRQLFDLAPEPKRLVILPAAGHNDPRFLVGELLTSEIGRFLQEMPEQGR